MAAPSINRLTIAGYKSLAEETTLDLRPLTILAGANSGGKSSIMQPLLLLKQTLASPSDPGVMEIGGPNVRFNRYEQMFFQCPGKKAWQKMKFEFSTGTDPAASRVSLHYRLHDQELALERQEVSIELSEGEIKPFVFKPGGLSDDEQAALPQQVRELRETFNKSSKVPFEFFNRVARGFIDLVMVSKEGSGPTVSAMGLEPDRTVRQQLLNLIHVPGLRGNPERSYLLRKTSGPRFDGLFQDYVAGIVASWRTKNDERIARLGESLKLLGLTWKVEAREVDATRVEILVGRLREPRSGGARDLVNIADVGFGVSQILPALVALEVAKPGQIVLLEQPEIHLHPRAQRALAKLLADAAKREVKLVVETHSSILIRGIQTLVAKGELDPNLVGLHWFERDDLTGATRVTSADLDEYGAFGMEWPEDFDDTYLQAEQEYLDAVEARAFHE